MNANDDHKTNETYTVKVGTPLLRPGLSISAKVSKGYVNTTVDALMGMVHVINHTVPEEVIRLRMVMEAQKKDLLKEKDRLLQELEKAHKNSNSIDIEKPVDKP